MIISLSTHTPATHGPALSVDNVCRQCRPTNVTFNFAYLLFFAVFLSKAVAFCREISHIIVGRRAIQSPIQHDRFLLRRFFSASKHANDSDKSRFFAEILRFFFIFVYSIKIRRKDKYCFFSKFFADGCRASMSANVVGSHCWPPKRQPTMLARVSRAIAIPRSEKTNQKTEMTPTANPVQ